MKNFGQYILEPLMESIVKYGERNAFCIKGVYYTYKQLSDRISVIRSVIRSADKQEQIWALAFHNDIDSYASIFALWMEGKAYVPLHPNQPLERNLNIIAQVECSNVLDSEAQSAFANQGVNIIATSQCACTYDYLDDWEEASEDDLAYILFTSGSTGVPKGVPLSRKNLAAFVKAFWDLGYELNQNDRCLQCFDLTFDLSVMSYLVPLLRGACVYTIPYDVVKYFAIAQTMMEHQLTFALMTPSTIQYLRPYFEEFEFPAMRYSLFCGEALPTDVAMEWSMCLPNADIDNVYGPTEDTIFCTTYRLRRDGNNVEHNGVLSIGTSMTSGKVIIVDDNKQEVHGDEVGELCLSGDQLTQGYWRNPEKNAEAFWIAEDGTRYYNSGDLCFYGEGGNINFVGRKDSQVKINGFRIELSEIEFHARQILGDTLVLVLAYTNSEGTQSLAMFIESDEQNNKPLHEYLSSKMPSYMMPTKYIYVPKLPVNSSNKIDRSALKKLI